MFIRAIGIGREKALQGARKDGNLKGIAAVPILITPRASQRIESTYEDSYLIPQREISHPARCRERCTSGSSAVRSGPHPGRRTGSRSQCRRLPLRRPSRFWIRPMRTRCADAWTWRRRPGSRVLLADPNNTEALGRPGTRSAGCEQPSAGPDLHRPAEADQSQGPRHRTGRDDGHAGPTTTPIYSRPASSPNKGSMPKP